MPALKTAQLASSMLDRVSQDPSYASILTEQQWQDVSALMSRILMEYERMDIVNGTARESDAHFTQLLEQSRDGKTIAITVHARGSAARRVQELLELGEEVKAYG